jgi:hypothetical protein
MKGGNRKWGKTRYKIREERKDKKRTKRKKHMKT